MLLLPPPSSAPPRATSTSTPTSSPTSSSSKPSPSAGATSPATSTLADANSTKWPKPPVPASKNITEGCERAATSSQTALKLLDVAKASICELRDDYLTFLMDRASPPWPADSPEARAVYAVRLDPADYGPDVNRGLVAHVIAQRAKFAPFFASPDPISAANALLVLITRALATLERLQRRVADDFTQNGGASERMAAARAAWKRSHDAPVHDDAPPCPSCGAPMRLLQSRRGPFWGYSAYPTCRATRPV